jgi:hypothetical protein
MSSSPGMCEAGGGGFEPPRTDSESAVLPLDEPPENAAARPPSSCRILPQLEENRKQNSPISRVIAFGKVLLATSFRAPFGCSESRYRAPRLLVAAARLLGMTSRGRLKAKCDCPSPISRPAGSATDTHPRRPRGAGKSRYIRDDRPYASSCELLHHTMGTAPPPANWVQPPPNVRSTVPYAPSCLPPPSKTQNEYKQTSRRSRFALRWVRIHYTINPLRLSRYKSPKSNKTWSQTDKSNRTWNNTQDLKTRPPPG